MSPKRGRPEIDNPKNERIQFRVTADEKNEIKGFCEKEKTTILELVCEGMKSIKKKQN